MNTVLLFTGAVHSQNQATSLQLQMLLLLLQVHNQLILLCGLPLWTKGLLTLFQTSLPLLSEAVHLILFLLIKVVNPNGISWYSHFIRGGAIWPGVALGGWLRLQRLHAQCVSGTLEIRWVNLPPTSQVLSGPGLLSHIHRYDDAQMIYCAALTGTHSHIARLWMNGMYL